MSVDYSEYIERLEALIASRCKGDVRNTLADQLGRVRQKQTDGKMYLALVGEFNAGKSTFINAFLRNNLLKESILPATAAATYIEGTTGEISVQVRCGVREVRGDARDWRELQQLVARYGGRACDSFARVITSLTSEQCVARQVESLRIAIPNLPILSTITIVDTPGFNPGDTDLVNHQEVTQAVVEQVADMALVLVPATQGLSATLIEFLEMRLARFLHRCLFVITKADQIEPEERDELVRYVRHQLKSKLNLEEPKIFLSSAFAVNHPLVEDRAHQHEWQERFYDFERFLRVHIGNYREIVLSEHLLALLVPLTTGLAHVMEDKTKEATAEKAAIETQDIVQIRKLTEKIYRKTKRFIHKQFEEVERSSKPYMESCLEELHELVYTTSLWELKRKLREEGMRIIKRKSSAYRVAVRRPIERLQKKLTQFSGMMEGEFARHYQELPYAYQWRTPSVTLHTQQLDVSVEDLSDEEIAGTTVLTGVVVAVALAFGVGWPIVIAGLLISGKKLVHSIRKKIIAKMDEKVKAAFGGMEEQVNQHLGECEREVVKEVKAICEAHVAEYGEKVKEWIQEKKQHQQQILQLIEQLREESLYVNHLQRLFVHELKRLKGIV